MFCSCACFCPPEGGARSADESGERERCGDPAQGARSRQRDVRRRGRRSLPQEGVLAAAGPCQEPPGTTTNILLMLLMLLRCFLVDVLSLFSR